MSRKIHVPAPKHPLKDVRERILEGAFAAFLEKGFAGTTTREIAARAKVSKRELYAHFQDKQAIVAACIKTKAQRALQPLALGPVHDRESLKKALEAYGTSFQLEMSQPNVLALYRLAAVEAQSSPEVGRALRSFGKQATIDTLGEFVRRAQAARLLGKGDPALVAQQFMGLVWGASTLWLMLGAESAPDKESATRRAREAAEALLRLFPPAGGGK
jgi:AcrR family transcriptional regulator